MRVLHEIVNNVSSPKTVSQHTKYANTKYTLFHLWQLVRRQSVSARKN